MQADLIWMHVIDDVNCIGRRVSAKNLQQVKK
jgi:hypothetical protein